MQATFYGQGQHTNQVNTAMKINISQREEKDLVQTSEQEFKRRCGFKRIFPSIDYGYYKQFFVEERPYNIVLDNKVMSKRRLTASNALYLRQKIA